MRYIENVLGQRNTRFWHCEFGIEDGNIQIYIRRGIERVGIQITQEKMIQFVNDCLIQNGLLCKYITFLENDEGQLEPFYSDSIEVKEAVAEYLVPKAEVRPGDRVNFFNVELVNYIDGIPSAHIYYMGRFVTHSDKKEHVFIAINEAGDIQSRHCVQAFPKILNREPSLSPEQIRDYSNRFVINFGSGNYFRGLAE